MKKILLLAVALLFGITALNAQGPWFLGGEVSYRYLNSAQNTVSNTYSIVPQVGYMLNDNWGLMLAVGFSRRTTQPDGESSRVDFNTFGGAIGAIYKYEIVDKFYYAPTLSLGYSKDTEFKIDYYDATFNVLRFELRPDCHWGINFNFGGIEYNRTSPNEGNSTDSVVLSVGDAYSVGFTFYF